MQGGLFLFEKDNTGQFMAHSCHIRAAFMEHRACSVAEELHRSSSRDCAASNQGQKHPNSSTNRICIATKVPYFFSPTAARKPGSCRVSNPSHCAAKFVGVVGCGSNVEREPLAPKDHSYWSAWWEPVEFEIRWMLWECSICANRMCFFTLLSKAGSCTVNLASSLLCHAVLRVFVMGRNRVSIFICTN